MILSSETVDKALGVHYNKHTVETYRSQLRPLIGEELEFGPIADWVDNSAGKAKSTVVVRRAALNSLLDYCESRELIDSSLTSRVKKLSFPSGKPKRSNEPVDDDTIQRLIGATQTEEEFALITILVHTGLRLGTVPRLTFKLASGKQEVITKRDKRIVVYANSEVRSAVVKLMDKREASPSDYIFINSSGGRSGYKKLYRIFKRIATRIEQPKLRPHQIRHTFATALDDEGISPVVIQQLMGHSNAETTMIYIHPNKDSMTSAVEALKRRHSK